MEYIIVQQLSLNDQMKAVNQRLEDGWECTGGVSTFAALNEENESVTAYTQAMIKKPYKDPFKFGMP